MTTQLDLNRTALVIVDPLIDLLSPQSVIWDLIGDHVQEIDLVAKLRRLRAAAERAGVRFQTPRPQTAPENRPSGVLAGAREIATAAAIGAVAIGAVYLVSRVT